MSDTSYYPDRVRAEARDFRARVRNEEHTGMTSRIASGAVQGNLVILPKDWAMDFMLFCRANPQPCPVIGVSNVGDPLMPALGEGLDIRTDLPKYRVFRDGQLDAELTNINELWQDDFVAFVLGCSFSFDEALEEADVPVRHLREGKQTAMFRTNIEATPVGPFSGNYVVSMRPMKPVDAIRAVQITSRFPNVHGAPVHLGDPAQIGISDITQQDFGDIYYLNEGEIPVFWACGVTPQVIMEQAKPPICITHAPSHMLVTDILNTELAML